MHAGVTPAADGYGRTARADQVVIFRQPVADEHLGAPH